MAVHLLGKLMYHHGCCPWLFMAIVLGAVIAGNVKQQQVVDLKVQQTHKHVVAET